MSENRTRIEERQFPSFTSDGKRIFIPSWTKYNNRLMKIPVATSGIRFPVNGNVEINKEYMDAIEPANVSCFLEQHY